MSKAHQATEQQSLEAALEQLPAVQAHLDKILLRLAPLRTLGRGAKVLDVGAAQGLLLLACRRRGLDAVGVEPWDAARDAAGELSRRQGATVDIRPGTAEKLPFDDGSFDFVHAQSVIEHVANPQAAFAEIRRVLKDDGVFWFSASSSLCPRQKEISGFPCFGWYPDRLKRKIMLWARDRRPELIGHTDTPAMNWFTPGKARAMLRRAGFRRIYDRWDLRRQEEGGTVHRVVLRVVRSCGLTKMLADVCVPACSYAAMK